MLTKIIQTLSLGLFLMVTARADLTIEITQGAEGALPIAIVPFRQPASGASIQNVDQIITSDLARSGRFQPLPAADMLSRPVAPEQVDFRDWRALNVENLVIGHVDAKGPNAYDVSFRLYDAYRGEQVLGYTLQTTSADLRSTAHRIADLIYETLTGNRGAFDTRVAYVTSMMDKDNKPVIHLRVADADGYAPLSIVSSSDPIMSPSWSPDGQKIAYVSFENGRSSIYVQEVYTGVREKLTSFQGINGAPAWSPDGTKLALTLSKDGNPDIYVMDLKTRKLNALTTHWAIDTEPSWSPDGKVIVFTSDRGGSPQIYRVEASGGKAIRLTYEGKYNAKASYSPDGKQLTLVTRIGEDYRIGLMDLKTRDMRFLSTGDLDESPSFAPNGDMIIYATRNRGRGILAAVSTDSRVEQRLVLQAGDVREPAWSPFHQNKGRHLH
jgi:TolB protein